MTTCYKKFPLADANCVLLVQKEIVPPLISLIKNEEPEEVVCPFSNCTYHNCNHTIMYM